MILGAMETHLNGQHPVRHRDITSHQCQGLEVNAQLLIFTILTWPRRAITNEGRLEVICWPFNILFNNGGDLLAGRWGSGWNYSDRT